MKIMITVSVMMPMELPNTLEKPVVLQSAMEYLLATLQFVIIMESVLITMCVNVTLSQLGFIVIHYYIPATELLLPILLMFALVVDLVFHKMFVVAIQTMEDYFVMYRNAMVF